MLCRIIDAIKRVCTEYHTRIGLLEDEKFDLEYIVKRKDMEVERWAVNEQLSFVDLQNLQKLYFHIKKINVTCDMSSAVLSLLRQLV